MEGVGRFLWLLVVLATIRYSMHQQPKKLVDVVGLMLEDSEKIEDLLVNKNIIVCSNVRMENVRHFSTQVTTLPQTTTVIQIEGDWVVQENRNSFTLNFENGAGVLQAIHGGQEVDFDKFVCKLTDGTQMLAYPHDKPPKYSTVELSGSMHLENRAGSVNKKQSGMDRNDTSVYIWGADQVSKVFVVFEEDSEKNKDGRVGVAAEYYQFSLHPILQRLTGFDTRRVPCFGSAIFLTFAYTNSSGNTPFTVSDSDMFTNTTLLKTWNGQLENNLVMKTKLSHWNDITFTITRTETNDGLILTPNVDEFEFYRLRDCLTSVQPRLQNNIVSLDRLSAAEVKVRTIQLSPAGNTLTIQVRSSGNRRLCYYYSFLCFYDFEAEIIIFSDNTYTVTIYNAKIQVGNASFIGNVSTDIIKANDSTISRRELENHFHANQGILPAEFYKWIAPNLQKSSLFYDPARWLDSVDFNAETTILQNQKVNIEALVHRQYNRFYVIYGFHLNNMNCFQFLNAISGHTYDTISLLQQNANIIIILSPIDIEDTPRYTQVRHGLYINTNITIPPQCGGDKFCSLLGNLYPQTTINLEATITNLQRYQLEAQLGDVELESLKFSNVRLFIVANAPPEPHYVLRASVSDTIYGVTFEGVLHEDGLLTLLRPDHDATINPGLSAKLLRGKAQIHSDGSIRQREYLSEVTVSCNHEACLKICQTNIPSGARVGVVTSNGINTYWAIENLNDRIALGCLLRSLNVTHATHWPLRAAYLLSGAFISYTDSEPVTLLLLQTTNRTIPKGRYISGRLNTLCETADIEAQSLSNDHTKVDINIRFPEIETKNGIFRMGKDSTGPSLRTVVGSAETMALQGHFRLMKMEFDGKMQLNDEGFALEISDGFLVNTMGTRYNVYLRVCGERGCIRKVEYLASGYFKDLNKTIVDILDPLMKAYAEDSALELPPQDFEPILQESREITGENNDAAAKVRNAQTAYENARKAVKPDHKMLQTNIQDAITQLSSAISKFNTICNHANKATSLATMIMHNLTAIKTNIEERMKKKELAEILKKNYELKLTIKMESVKLVDLNAGRFDATASLSLEKGGSARDFSMQVDLDNINSMTRRVADNIGTGFGFLVEK